MLFVAGMLVSSSVDPLAQVAQAFREHLLEKALHCMAQPQRHDTVSEEEG